MRKRQRLYLGIALTALGVGAAGAAGPPGVATHPHEAAGAATGSIELPDAAASEGRESSRHGIDTANEWRERGTRFGRGVAEGARDLDDGASFGRDVSGAGRDLGGRR